MCYKEKRTGTTGRTRDVPVMNGSKPRMLPNQRAGKTECISCKCSHLSLEFVEYAADRMDLSQHRKDRQFLTAKSTQYFYLLQF